MITKDSITGINLSDKKDFFCEDCSLSKQVRLPFLNTHKSDVALDEIIHADVCGPMQTPLIGGARFFLLLKDESSGFKTGFKIFPKA